MSQFLDQVRIYVHSGDGGNGIVAWRREKYEPMGGPAGGTGGKGASVYLQVSPHMNTLLRYKFKSKFDAPHGARGGPKNKHGKDGPDLVLEVPPGTVVTDLQSDQVIADLVQENARIMVAEGGRGGRGNGQLATSTRRSPHFCEPGEPGISRWLQLELKLLADAGIVGLPNAGKSTLISLLTAAHPKIADYPFSTLEPNLGVLSRPDGDGYVLADVPGLISGASSGAGLGHQFLRHLERTRLLLHMIDAGEKDLEQSIHTINHELSLHSNRLAKLPQILVVNKTDLLGTTELSACLSDLNQKLSALYEKSMLGPPLALIGISCVTRSGIDDLRNMILRTLQELPLPSLVHVVQPDLNARAHDAGEFAVSRHKGRFIVSGVKAERLLEVTNLKDPESLHHMYYVLRAMGIVDELYRQGVEPGSEVVIGKTSFSFAIEQ